MCTTEQRASIEATIRRLHIGITEKDLQVELAWSLHEFISAEDGSIHWKAFTLGQQLLLALAESQNWRCCYCGIQTTDYGTAYATLEHVQPKSKGGLDHPDNLVMACSGCNNARSKPSPFI